MKKEQVEQIIQILVEKFERNKYHYLSKHYLEEQAKIDFINPLFEALGWDMQNVKGLSPYEREVVVEKGETTGRPDYNFRIGGQTKFFVEAKAPHEPLHKIDHILQAKSYAWNTKQVFVVLLTDFEEFRLFDASLKPNPKNPEQGLIFDLKYTDYLKNLDKLLLLSKQKVQKGSLDRLLLKDSISKRLRIPVDKSFLEDMSRWREELAKDIYKRNQPISVRMLNEVVQKILDRLIFIRIAEDRKIVEPKTLLEIVELWKVEGKRKKLQSHLNILFRQLNEDFDGEILKPHACEILEIDSHLLAKVIENLYFPECIYKFDVIGVDLLGSIYERYLGKTIRVTPKRVKVEEKPEVRKAGGVYYTPQYIVDYIVQNTVGRIIKGKTPKQISKIKILDPACGSGSFLLSAFQTLIEYHLEYYTKHPDDVVQGKLFPDIITNYNGTIRLSIERKTHILTNNIFGVDIDPQAVEIAMMSLYLKCLEGEKDLPQKKELLPSLAKNIRCGNSLISYDIYDQPTLFGDEEKERINPFDWYSKSTGFGNIMEKGGFDVVIGNPPWGGLLSQMESKYLREHFISKRREAETHLFFIERGIILLKPGGLLGFITPNTWLYLRSASDLRKFILYHCNITRLTELSKRVFVDAPDIVPLLIFVFRPFIQKKVKIKIAVQILSSLPRISSPLDLSLSKDKHIDQNTWKKLPGYVFNLKITKEFSELLSKIERAGFFLSTISDIWYGIKTGNNIRFLSEKPSKPSHKKALKTKEVSRYNIVWRGVYLDYCPQLAGYRTSRIEVPKIIVQYIRKLSLPRRIIASADLNGEYYPLNNYSYIIPRKDLDINYLLGILNSTLMNFYFNLTFIDYNIKPMYLSQLPIRMVDFDNSKEKAMHDKIVELVDKMLRLNKKKNVLPPSSLRESIEREIKITDEKIDELVYELYGITEKEWKIIEESD